MHRTSPSLPTGLLLGGLLLGFLAGCGASNTVTGKVTLDGQPLKTGTVTFSPKHEAPAATGQIDSSGNYRLTVGTSANIAPGQYQVAIEAVELVPPTPTDPSPVPKQLAPPKYKDPSNPEMVREVKSGPNTIDFELKSM